MKKTLLFKTLFISLLIIISCAESTENLEDNIQEESTETLLESEEEFIEDEDSFIEDELYLPDNILNLIFEFEVSGSEISSTIEKELHADPNERPFTSFETEAHYDLDLGHLFLYSTNHGASDLSYHTGYYFAYFNRQGDYLNTKNAEAIDEKADIKILQNKFICFANPHTEWVPDESGMMLKESGNEITDYKFFTFSDNGLTSIEELSKSELPFLRNGLFAYHGYIFKTKKYADHFTAFEWYNPQHENVDHLMSSEEKALSEVLKKMEQ